MIKLKFNELLKYILSELIVLVFYFGVFALAFWISGFSFGEILGLSLVSTVFAKLLDALKNKRESNL